MRLRRTIVVVSALPSLLIVARPAIAQSVPDTVNVDQEAARMLDEPGGTDADPDELFDYLDGLGTLPRTIYGLHTRPEVSWIAAHRELQNVMRNDTVSVDSASRYSLRSRTGTPLNAQGQQGFQTGQYLGSPYAIEDRVRARSPQLELGVVQDKRSWEPQFGDRLNGFVALRSPVQIAGPLHIQHAVVGDYTLAFGDGLLFGGGASSGKSLDAVNAVEQRSFGIRGTLNNSSSRGLRGGAVEFGVGPASIAVFASDRFIDANIQGDTIQTLYPSPYHRTASELAYKNTAETGTTGIRAVISNADTSNTFLSVGATAFEFSYDHPYSGTPSAPFIGTSIRAASIDALAVGQILSATAEAALSASDTGQAVAWTISGVAQPSSTVGISLLYRHIPYGFISPYGEMSGSAMSSLSNANGVYLGVEFSPIDSVLRLNAYADVQNSLLPISTLFEKQKPDYFAASFLTLFSGALDLSLAFRANENTNITTVQDSLRSIYATITGDQTSIRLEAEFHANSDVHFKTKIEHLSVTSPTIPFQQGWIAMEELRAWARQIHSSLSISVSRFQTDSYYSSMYLYEGSVPSSGAVLLLDGSGWRVGFRATTHILKNLTFSLATTGSIFDAPRTIGSGLTARTGTTDFTGYGQIDFSF